VEAEITYWRLALARQSVRISVDALIRAQRIHEWNARRARLSLGDRADTLQAEALLEIRKLELQAARDELRAASQSFNLTRAVPGAEVEEELAELEPKLIDALQPPARAPMRDDVRAAEQQALASQAGSRLAQERNKPQLDLYGSYALNGRQPELAPALGEPFKAHLPSRAIGVRLTLPLDLGTLSDTRAGYRREEVGSEMVYRARLFDQEESWRDLTTKLAEARRRLKLALEIERAQEEKLRYERARREKGRTTTYQILLFEQDFSQAQLQRLRAEADALTIHAQLKLFAEES
jgi:outer membrane protein TolC